VAFDIGRCPQRATQQQTVLFSHGHLDHVVGVGSHAKSRWVVVRVVVGGGEGWVGGWVICLGGRGGGEGT
jgi:phosphoribosyl 1,2-cyclic phosphodiesterase